MKTFFIEELRKDPELSIAYLKGDTATNELRDNFLKTY
jgi:hypothetical protein